MSTIADTSPGGQAAAQLLARARRALFEEGELSTAGLLGSYRALSPTLHPGAGADRLDAAFVARCRAFGGDELLRARRVQIRIGVPRSRWHTALLDEESVLLTLPASDWLSGAALALTLGLSLEAAKLAHGLTASADELRAVFATPTEARAVFDMLGSGGADRLITTVSDESEPRVDRTALASLMTGDRPAYVVCGAGAHRMHDLLSPYARRLRDGLTAIGRTRALPRDEEVYAGLDVLLGDAGIQRERLLAELADGVVPCGDSVVALRCEAIPETEVDRRAREATTTLKRARAVLICVEPDAGALQAVLSEVGRAIKAVVLLVAANRDGAPAFLGDLASGHVVHVPNALDAAGLLQTAPWPLIPTPSSGWFDGTAFTLFQSVVAAQASSQVSSDTRVAVRAVLDGDMKAMSEGCLDVLRRLGVAPPRARR